ncbi:MAG: hypothetical protein IPN76_31825 [Saprospiraceae bacterium]|nr:hypothetical protein [Saprospiraceae bacterium]
MADTVSETVQRKDVVMYQWCVTYLEGAEPDPSEVQVFHQQGTRMASQLRSLMPEHPNTKRRLLLDWWRWLRERGEWTALCTCLPTRFRTPSNSGSFFEFEQTGVNIIAPCKGSKPPFKDQRRAAQKRPSFPLESWNKGSR